MAKASFETRIAKLEQQVAQLLASGVAKSPSVSVPADSWKSAIGAFKGAGMKEVLDEALKIREEHRAEYRKQQTRRRTSAKRRKVAS